jgi:hypothetical protein
VPLLLLQAFPYCPNWALSWGSRRRRILRDISDAKCDIIALQVHRALSTHTSLFPPTFTLSPGN